MEWTSVLPPASWVAVTCHVGWGPSFPGVEVEVALLRAVEWLSLCDVGPLRRCTKTLSQQMVPEDWRSLLRHHLEHMPFPTDSTLRYLRLSTVQLSENLREGRIFPASCMLG